MLKAAIISLGCAKNLVDSEVITGMLKDAGYQISNQEAEADILVVNTCGFINSAKEESVNAILDAAKYKEEGNCKALVVTGCLAQRYKEDLLSEIPEIDGLIGTGEIPRIVSVLKDSLEGNKTAYVGKPTYIYNHETPRVVSTPRYSAYLKVADGCDNRCTYCAIPEIRGDFRSRPMESIVTEAAELGKQGVRELNLIAQDTTRYGQDLYGDFKLDSLLKELVKLDDIKWLRLLYAYPTHFTDDMIQAIAENDKICKYIDLPLQHADDEILMNMNRRGSQQDIRTLIEKLRNRIPGLAIRTSFIVGFPGETEEKFQQLVEFVKQVKFDRLGVFAYSPEEGTPAVDMPDQVPEEVKEKRVDTLMKIQQDISYEKNKNKIGQIVEVLVEGKNDTGEEVYIGRTGADAPEVDGKIILKGRELAPGDFVKAKITHAYEYDLIGEVMDEFTQ